MKAFTLGGQTTLNHLRMFMQVLGKVMSISFALLAILLATFVFSKTTSYERYVGFKMIEAIFIEYFPMEIKRTITFKIPQHAPFELKTQHFLNSEGLYKTQQKFKAVFWQSLTLAGIMAFSLAILLAIFLSRRSKKMSEKRHVRGARFLACKQLNKKIESFNQQEKKRYQQNYGKPWVVPDTRLGGLTQPLEADTQHLLMVGAPGAGKTNTTHEILAQVMKNKQKAIIYDIEGIYIPSYYRPGKDIILNPLDARTPSWNLWADCKNITNFDDLATMLIPDGNHSGGDGDFWQKAARVMFSVGAAQYGARAERPHIRALLKQLFASNKNAVESLLKGTMGQAMIGKDLEKGTKSIILTLATYCSSLLYIKDDPEEKPFSLREWVHNEEDSFLFISSKEEYQAALAPIFSMWLDILLSAFLSLPENYDRRLWLYFDELSSLNKQTKLIPFLERGRKRGGCFVGSIHDRSQLEHIYGRAPSHTQKSLIGTTLYFYANNDQAAHAAAEHLGQEEFVETRESRQMGAHEMRDGVGLSEMLRKDYVVLPAEISNLKKREAYYRTAGGWPVTKLKFEQQKRTQTEPAFVSRDQEELSHVLDDLNELESLKERVLKTEQEIGEMEALLTETQISSF